MLLFDWLSLSVRSAAGHGAAALGPPTPSGLVFFRSWILSLGEVFLVRSRLPVKKSLRYRLTELEELDERRRVAAQHIEAIQRQKKKTFDKRNKKRALEPGMLVMIQDARKMDFLGKFDALWLGPYVVQAVFLNNSLQLETLNGESFPWRTSGSRCKQFRA